MWNVTLVDTDRTDVLDLRVAEDGRPVSREQFLYGLAAHAQARAALVEILRSAPLEACFWECAPFSLPSADVSFRSVLVASRRLARLQADSGPFEEHLEKAGHVASFRNLGGDAWLIAPVPVSGANYAHLASFVREAPDDQVQAFFREVGRVALRELSDEPRWLSTAGLGVSWLHVRVDSRPKYFRYHPFKARDA